MTGRAVVVGRRLASGTWRQLEAWSRWQLALDYAPGKAGLGVHVRRFGVALRRAAMVVAALVFYGLLLQRVPGGIYLVPIVWAVGAWQMSDSSATPPPGKGRPSCRECAGHELVGVTPSENQKGMLIYTTAPPDRPNHTHVHVVHDPAETTA